MSPDTASSASIPAVRRRRWLPWLLLLVALAAVGGLALWARLGRSPSPTEFPPDPPVEALVSPFLNTRPGVKYVGDQVCAGCHGKLARTYHNHPMGRSAAAALPGDGLERVPAVIHTDRLRLAVLQRGQQLVHQATLLNGAGKPLAGMPVIEANITYLLGSGVQGRSYVVDRGGYLYQSPMSWYSRIKNWGVSPGYQQGLLLFNRPLMHRCVLCHADGAVPVKGTINRFQTPVVLRPIGCERCHGPGELHVAARRRGEEVGEVDPTIVNPRHLEPELREAVCQQCHLQGKVPIERRGRSAGDYRPGLPLSAFLSIFIEPPERADGYKAVSHAEQMRVSQCFQASKGKLGCISCHDPHHEPAPAQRVSYFRTACLKCHHEDSCSLPLAERRAKERDDSCIACHMPRKAATDIAHAAITDHRILRHPNQPLRSKADPDQQDFPLVCFFGDKKRGADPELDRDLAVALITVTSLLIKDAEENREIARRTLPLLDKAVQRAPGDVPAWLARGTALEKLGRRQSALASLETALKREPHNEMVLSEAVKVAEACERPDLALEYSQRLVAINPTAALYRALLARAHFVRNEWSAATAAARRALELDPADCDARTVLIGCLVHQGDRKTAQAEFELMMALQPPNAEELRRWYENLEP
jgi:hypothetical protein